MIKEGISITMQEKGRMSFEEFLEKGTKEEIDFFVREYIDSFDRNSMGSFLFRQYILLEVFCTVKEFFRDSHHAKREIADNMFGDNYHLTDIDTLDKTKDYLSRLLNLVIDLRNRHMAVN